MSNVQPGKTQRKRLQTDLQQTLPDNQQWPSYGYTQWHKTDSVECSNPFSKNVMCDQ